MDLFDLIVGEAVFRSVDQIFDSCKLVDENKILIVSKVVDGVKISVQGVWFYDVIINQINLQVENGTNDLEQILLNIIVFNNMFL